jgi:hypothetical protein
VLNCLISADKWDAYSEKEMNAVIELRSSGLILQRVEIPDAGSQGQLQEVIYLSWKIDIK